ncbi:MAG: RagB/SusD family nutrient uptake outer membrane protein [Prevotella sp.]|jgi:hypothetical protein|nr:RagB/SusD family nutrient uptake outer membrane protein [Prevotella sp.]MCH3995049.1 RagB/SusD family nutrient uptake outer membrane protein [Prevotella sp.]
MKRYKFSFGIACMVVSLLCSSCSNFLQESSQDEFEPKTAESYQELLNGEGYLSATAFDNITNIMSDDVNGLKAPSYVYTTTNTAYESIYTWQPDMDATLVGNDITNMYNGYQSLYKAIMVCNLTIDAINGTEGTDDEKKQTLGEALALRAFYYFYLVNMYASPYNTKGTTPDKLQGVPLITKSEIKDEGPTRNTVAEVYAQITSDIEQACTLLDQEKSNNVGLYRINYVAAHLIASRIYLFMENWDKVIEHATASLAGAPGLCDLKNYSFSNPSYLYRSTNEVISDKFPETIFVGGNKASLIVTEGTPWGVSDDLMSSYENNDLRKTKYFQQQSASSFYPYYMAKHGTSEQMFTWRTSELYLNRAEAYAEKYASGVTEDGEKAIADLNTLRSNRFSNYVPWTLTTASDLIQRCRDERRRELCFEFQRWFDLRRYGMPSIRHTWYDASGNKSYYTLQASDPGYVLPIPDEALSENVNLQQNPLASHREGTAD